MSEVSRVSWPELALAAWDAIDALVEDRTGWGKWLNEGSDSARQWEEHESFEFLFGRARKLFMEWHALHKGADPFLNSSEVDLPAVLWLAARIEAEAHHEALDKLNKSHESDAADAVRKMWGGPKTSLDEAMIRWAAQFITPSEDPNQIELDSLREEALSEMGWPDLYERFDAEVDEKFDFAGRHLQAAIAARRGRSH